MVGLDYVGPPQLYDGLVRSGHCQVMVSSRTCCGQGKVKSRLGFTQTFVSFSTGDEGKSLTCKGHTLPQ
jgi:hypothetical protein